MQAMPSLPVTGHMPPFVPSVDWNSGRGVSIDPRHAPRIEPGQSGVRLDVSHAQAGWDARLSFFAPGHA
jgi:hypothetical protein